MSYGLRSFLPKNDMINILLLAVLIMVIFPLSMDIFRLNLVGKYLSYAFVALGLALCWFIEAIKTGQPFDPVVNQSTLFGRVYRGCLVGLSRHRGGHRQQQRDGEKAPWWRQRMKVRHEAVS